MSRTLDTLLREADEMIEKKASVKKTTNTSEIDEEVVKLAELLFQEGTKPEVKTEKTASVIEETVFEKMVRAVAITEAIISMEKVAQVSKFEKTAMEHGYSDEDISKFLSEKNMLPLHRMVSFL